MAKVSITKNALDVQNSTSVLKTNEKTLNDFLEKEDTDLYNDAWLLVLIRKNKTYYPLREEWDTIKLKKNDSLHFIYHVGADPISIIIAVIVVIAVVVTLFLSIDPPQFEDNRTEPDPLYTLSGRRNQARLNSPIEDAYGRNKLWVSYISSPYTKYIDNEQDLYQLFSLGQGSDFEIEDVLIEDSVADGFVGIDYRFDDISFFRNNVSPSREVSNLELFGSNQSGWNDDNSGYIGGFALSPPNTVTKEIEIDFTLPNGCYYVDTKGRTSSLKVSALWQVRRIDNDGKFLGSGTWQTLYSYNQRLATNQGVRISKKIGVQLGRYEIRAKRINKAFIKTTGTNKIVWEGAKAYLGDMTQPNNMVTLSVKTRASQNTVKNKVNVLATRKIPVWDGTWSQPVTSRNPIWAMCNILRSDHGGRMEDEDLDLEGLKICADLADENNETLDYVFDQKTTVWDAMKICCFVCRSTPLVQGNKITAKRDTPNTIPVQLFNGENIYRDSFRMSRVMPAKDENDGLKVEYYDHETWRDETYTALLDHQTGIDPKVLKLRGVTNRTHAAKLANYTLESEYNNRVSIEFETTHSAIVASYGDLIKVQHDVPEWGSGGHIEQISGNIVSLSEKPVFQSGFYSNTYVIWVRDKIGDVYGPYPVAPVEESDGVQRNKVELLSGGLPANDFPINDNSDNPHYIFGKQNDDGVLCRITKVQNNGIDKVKIFATTENYVRFLKDGFVPEDIEYPELPDIVDLTLTTFEVDYLLSSGLTMTLHLVPTCIIDPSTTNCTVFDYIEISISSDNLNFELLPKLYPSDLTNERYTFTFPEESINGYWLKARVSINGDLGDFTDAIFYYPNAEVLLGTDEDNEYLIDNEENSLYSPA